MSTILYIPNPDRELTDVTVKGWPVIITKGLMYGSLGIPPNHVMNVTGRHEIHMTQRAYSELTINTFAWPILEQSIDRLEILIRATKRD
jgi:hypothetical protein